MVDVVGNFGGGQVARKTTASDFVYTSSSVDFRMQAEEGFNMADLKGQEDLTDKMVDNMSRVSTAERGGGAYESKAELDRLYQIHGPDGLDEDGHPKRTGGASSAHMGSDSLLPGHRVSASFWLCGCEFQIGTSHSSCCLSGGSVHDDSHARFLPFRV